MRQVYVLETFSKDNISERFYVTEDHPWLNSAHVWVATKDLKIGDMLEAASGEDHKVTNITATNQFAQTYNLTIANNHTFLVGNGQFVVHNMSCDPKKVYSDAKKALVAMAKLDKKLGVTQKDMDAYKELNKLLKDPFPDNLVRGLEKHGGTGPGSKPHGHVGPIGHIPGN